MSVQFGRWNFDGQPLSVEYIDKVNATLAPYGPDKQRVLFERWGEDSLPRVPYHKSNLTVKSSRILFHLVLQSPGTVVWTIEQN